MCNNCDLKIQELIFDMYSKILEGNDVVVKRIKGKAKHLLKIISKVGYQIIEKISDVKIPRDTGDYRIITKKIINHLKELKRPTLFLEASCIRWLQTSFCRI